MSLAGPDLSRLIYQSTHFSVSDVSYQASYGPSEYRLESGTMVFVRSGAFTARIGGREFVADANYMVAGSEGDALIAPQKSKTACTCSAIRYVTNEYAPARKAPAPLQPRGISRAGSFNECCSSCAHRSGGRPNGLRARFVDQVHLSRGGIGKRAAHSNGVCDQSAREPVSFEAGFAFRTRKQVLRVTVHHLQMVSCGDRPFAAPLRAKAPLTQSLDLHPR